MSEFDYGTCDNCGGEGSRRQNWTATTRPDAWPKGTRFMICQRCVNTVRRNLLGRAPSPTDGSPA